MRIWIPAKGNLLRRISGVRIQKGKIPPLTQNEIPKVNLQTGEVTFLGKVIPKRKL
jgi:hypothetical protein